MKLSHIILIATILPVTAFAETSDQPQSNSTKAYIGFNVHYLRAQLNDKVGETFSYASSSSTDTNELINPNHSGLSLNIGAQFDDNFSLEAFLEHISSSTADIDFYYTGNKISHYKSKTSGLAFGLDAMGYAPITDTKFSFIGSFGVGYYKFDGEFNVVNYVTNAELSESGDETNVAFRIGFGGQYAFAENLALRGMVRYIALNSDDNEDAVDGLIDISLGLKYTF